MTLEDFYEEVLGKLKVLAAEESPSASDRAKVADKYDQLHAEYSRRDIIPWFVDEDVPDWASDSFATIVADRLSNQFSVPQTLAVQLKVDAQMAVTTIVADGQRRIPPDVKNTYY